jgi:hypothetical protein
VKAGDDEEMSVKLVQTVENFVYLYDFSHEYYANNNDIFIQFKERFLGHTIHFFEFIGILR